MLRCRLQRSKPTNGLGYLKEAQDQVTIWLSTYNNERTNMGIGNIIPEMKLKKAA
jgi:hypothetical protein